MDREELRARCQSAHRVGDKLAGWDTCEILQAQVNYLLEECPDDYESKDAAWQDVAEDSDFWSIEWGYFLEYLGELAAERGFFDEPVFAEVCNFGWRGLDGADVKYFSDAADLLRKVLPKTECTFFIYAYGENGLAINNYHHDSPTGREWYYLVTVGDERCDECGVVYLNSETERDSIKEHGMCTECYNWHMPCWRSEH